MLLLMLAATFDARYQLLRTPTLGKIYLPRQRLHNPPIPNSTNFSSDSSKQSKQMYIMIRLFNDMHQVCLSDKYRDMQNKITLPRKRSITFKVLIYS